MRKIIELTLIPIAAGLVFTLIYAIYGLPPEAIVYAWLLTFFIGGILGGGYVLRWKMAIKRVKIVTEGADKTVFSENSFLPPMDSLESSYQALVLMLVEENQNRKNEQSLKLSDLKDNYTLWVHQIKTPIAALDLMLQTQPDTEKTRAMKLELFKIEQYVELALHIMRLDADSSDLMLRPYELEDLVSGTIRKYKSLFIEKHIRLDLQLTPIKVLTDEKWLSVVLEQLISNALKYTQSGSIRIYNDEATPLKLVVADTGIGICLEDLPRVFEKGFTGFNGRIDKHATGIGLYVTKRVCDRLGMRITLDSEVNQGTKAILELIPYSSVSLEMKM